MTDFVRVPVFRRGQHPLFALVDAQDAEKVKAYRWHLSFKGRGIGYAQARRVIANPNAYKGRKVTTILMHRLVMGVETPQTKVLHRSDCTLDNRRSNLRVATSGQNNALRSAHSTKRDTLFKGVYLRKSRRVRKWMAALTVDGRQVTLGYYETDVDAAVAFDIAARKLHGEFARTNEDLGLLPRWIEEGEQIAA